MAAAQQLEAEEPTRGDGYNLSADMLERVQKRHEDEIGEGETL